LDSISLTGKSWRSFPAENIFRLAEILVSRFLRGHDRCKDFRELKTDLTDLNNPKFDQSPRKSTTSIKVPWNSVSKLVE